MLTENKGGKTLVINTAQPATFERFYREKDNLLSGSIRLYDTASTCPDPNINIIPLKPGIFSYLKVLTKEKPDNIVITFDRSRSAFFYFTLVLFIFIASIMGKDVKYYSQEGTFANIADQIPLGWPFQPFSLLWHAPQILAMYVRCFPSHQEQGRVVAFNSPHAHLTFWYETEGKKQLRYGCWGYCYEGNFGESNRNKFYHHYLSYGYLLNKLGFHRFHFLAAGLYLTSFLATFIASGNWLWGVILLPVVLISPYYIFSFLAYNKPENIAWFLALPAFYCASTGLVIPLAVLLLLSTYLSFTVFFFTSAGVIVLLCSQLNPVILLAFVPSGLKLLVDFYHVIGDGFLSRILLPIVSGKKGEKRATSRRKYGIKHAPITYAALFMLTVVLLILQVVLNIGAWPVTAIFILLFIVNFQFVRFADAQSFYRFFLSILLFGLLSTTNVYYFIVGCLILMVNPGWVDDFKLMLERISGKAYPPVAKIVYAPEVDALLKEFVSHVQPGSRVLFEYIDHVGWSPFRNTLSVLGAKFFDRHVTLLPDEYTFYSYPHFSYDWSCHLSPKGDLDIVNELLESCGITHVIVFSKDLLDRLSEKGYQLVSELELNGLRSVLGDKNIPTERIYLLYRGKVSNYCSDSSVILERSPNQMVLKGLQAGSEYIIRCTYDKDWRAFQNSQELVISPAQTYGLEFMKIKAVSSSDILCRFGKLNHFIR